VDPGNAHFVVSYTGESSRIWGQIYDVTGAEILSFQEVKQGSAGKILFDWDGRDKYGNDLSSGVYFVHIRDDRGERLTERFVLVK